eukprot:6194254-Pleurochrysis_carterae.AAC.2
MNHVASRGNQPCYESFPLEAGKDGARSAITAQNLPCFRKGQRVLQPGVCHSHLRTCPKAKPSMHHSRTQPLTQQLLLAASAKEGGCLRVRL